MRVEEKVKKGRERGVEDEKNHPAWRKNLKIKQTKMWGRCGREKREREKEYRANSRLANGSNVMRQTRGAD